MLLAGRLVGKIDARLLVGLGVVLMGTSLWMMTGFALDQPSGPVIWSGVVQGLGLGLIFVPLQTLYVNFTTQVLQAIANAITTNKTDFFREAHHFRYLADHWVPAMKARAARDGLRAPVLGSAGAARGRHHQSQLLGNHGR